MGMQAVFEVILLCGVGEVVEVEVEVQVVGRFDVVAAAETLQAVADGFGAVVEAEVEDPAAGSFEPAPSQPAGANTEGKVEGEESLAGGDLTGKEVKTRGDEAVGDEPGDGGCVLGDDLAGGEILRFGG